MGKNPYQKNQKIPTNQNPQIDNNQQKPSTKHKPRGRKPMPETQERGQNSCLIHKPKPKPTPKTQTQPKTQPEIHAETQTQTSKPILKQKHKYRKWVNDKGLGLVSAVDVEKLAGWVGFGLSQTGLRVKRVTVPNGSFSNGSIGLWVESG